MLRPVQGWLALTIGEMACIKRHVPGISTPEFSSTTQSFTNFWHRNQEHDLLAARNPHLSDLYRDVSGRALQFFRSRSVVDDPGSVSAIN